MNSDLTSEALNLSASDLNPMLSFQPFILRDDVDEAFFLASLKNNLKTLVLHNSRTGTLKPGTNEAEFFPITEEAILGWTMVGAAWSLRRAVTWLADAPLDTPPKPQIALIEDEAETDQGEDLEKVKANWERHESLLGKFEQVTWNLLLIGLRTKADGSGEAALHCTDSAVRSTVADFLLRGQFGDLFHQKPMVQRLPKKLIEAVCLDGNARQAALSGIHRQINTKADKKALSGPKLQDAFDPFDDQTFRLESAVSVSETRKPAFLGVALRNQQVWSTRGNTVQDYAGQLSVFFDTVGQTKAKPALVDAGGLQQSGYKSLATEIEETALDGLAKAMDVDFRPRLDLTEEDDENDGKSYIRELERRWFEDGAVVFESGDIDSASVTYVVTKEGRSLLRQTVTPRNLDGEISIEVDRTETLVDPEDPDLELFEGLCANGNLAGRLAIWYESGHVLVDRRLSQLKYTDVLFENGWKWLSFKHDGIDFDVTAEKPTKPNKKGTGKTAALEEIGDQDSIFCYLLKYGPDLIGAGEPIWSICDDGASEIADFILFAPKSLRLWVIHAKGANVSFSAKEKADPMARHRKLANRGLSVSAYEQVVGQATKNLRFLDPKLLADALEERNTQHIWWDGARAPDPDVARALIISQLRENRMLSERVLVVAQPHVHADAWTKAEEGAALDVENAKATTKTYKLLCALLADLQITSQKVGAKFYVLGQKM